MTSETRQGKAAAAALQNIAEVLDKIRKIEEARDSKAAVVALQKIADVLDEIRKIEAARDKPKKPKK